MTSDLQGQQPWYRGITRYQWLVLVIASLGWIFDVFEGQVFVASMNEAMPALLPQDAPAGSDRYFNNLAFGFFLMGGALGGVLFGMLSDRIGRTRTMVFTILMYACFTAVTALAQSPWQMVLLRFLVAMGVGGEWAVASAMVAEVMPKAARARLLGVFHASSVFGTYLAVAAGVFIVRNADLHYDLDAGLRSLGPLAQSIADQLTLTSYDDLNWRLAFLVGALPALLTIWIRLRLREPEQWVQARQRAAQDVTQKAGRVFDLFSAELLRPTLVGVSLAAVGLATFWGVHIYGKDLMRRAAERRYADQLPAELTQDGRPHQAVLGRDVNAVLELMPGDEPEQTKLATLADQLAPLKPPEVELESQADDAELVSAVLDNRFEWIKGREMLGMFLVTTGGGLGLLLFGPICERIGRRGAFLLYHVGGLAVALVLFQGIPQAEMSTYLWTLPIFGFLTLGMHAGYAIYFPELFPTRLRGTGGGFCFNMGRIIAAPILFISGWMQRLPAEGGLGLSLETAASILSVLYLLGVVILLFAPETKGQDLPE